MAAVSGSQRAARHIGLARPQPATRTLACKIRCETSIVSGNSTRRSSKAGTSGGLRSSFDEDAGWTFERWEEHRAPHNRYLRHLKGIATSGTLRNLAKPLALLTANATALSAYNSALDTQVQQMQPLMQLAAHYLPHLHLPTAPFDFLSVALSLLLVFRTNSSHARWEEAMTAFNSVKASCIQLVRLAGLVDDPLLSPLLRRWSIAFFAALRVHVRGGGEADIMAATRSMLTPQEQRALARADSYPHFALQVMAGALEQASLSSSRETAALEILAQMNQAIATCEKIQSFPIPLSYTRHTSRFLLLFLGLLPLSLWPDCGWAAVPITTALSYVLLGVEEIGVQIEEPFRMLPLESLCRDVQAAARNATTEHFGVQEIIAQQRERSGITAAAAGPTTEARLPAKQQARSLQHSHN